jgi:hypothetical protein
MHYLMGLYNIMPGHVFDLRPVYTHNASICKPAVPCTTKTVFLYYDSSTIAWKVGPEIGEGNGVFAYRRSTATQPNKISGVWKVFDETAHDFLPAKKIETACAGVGYRQNSQYESSHDLVAETDSECQSWVASKTCNPEGTPEPNGAKKCDADIGTDVAGYCLCGPVEWPRKVKVACGHSTFKCRDSCKVTFPAVIAQSGERVWTNQFAYNLVQQQGDWASSGTEDQWVLFDLGVPHDVTAIALQLFGSTANPKHVLAGYSSNQAGPFETAKSFEVPKLTSTSVDVAVHAPAKARFWRLKFKDNWGADWGMGLNQVLFTYAEKAPTPAPAPDTCEQYTTCNTCIFMSMLQGDEACGWCTGAHQAGWCGAGGSTAPAVSSAHPGRGCPAPGKWLWTTCAPDDGACDAHQSCQECSVVVNCGWCAETRSCRSGGCKRWALRSCDQDAEGNNLQMHELIAEAKAGSTKVSWQSASRPQGGQLAPGPV